MYVPLQQWMVMLIREMLHGKREGDEDEAQVQLKARRQAALIQWEKIVAAIVEVLLQMEELQETMIAMIQEKNRSVGDQIVGVAVFMLLAVFCEVRCYSFLLEMQFDAI